MVVIFAPDALRVVPNVRVVMAALGRAIVNADTVQVVRHPRQRRILVVQLPLLFCDLLFQAPDLCGNFAMESL